MAASFLVHFEVGWFILELCGSCLAFCDESCLGVCWHFQSRLRVGWIFGSCLGVGCLLLELSGSWLPPFGVVWELAGFLRVVWELADSSQSCLVVGWLFSEVSESRLPLFAVESRKDLLVTKQFATPQQLHCNFC